MALVLFFLPLVSEAVQYDACHSELSIKAEPDFSARKVGEVPRHGKFELIYEYGMWALIDYKGTEGWVSSAGVCSEKVTRAQEIQFLLDGTEKAEGRYRHNFGIFNKTESIFAGRIRLSIYNEKRIIFTEEYEFSLDYIPAKTGRAFHVDTEEDMTGYLFEVVGGFGRPIKLPEF
jgi:hypothetical protein